MRVGGIVVVRCTAGWKAIARNGLIGGVLLALIEGASIVLMKTVAKQQQGMPLQRCFRVGGLEYNIADRLRAVATTVVAGTGSAISIALPSCCSDLWCEIVVL